MTGSCWSFWVRKIYSFAIDLTFYDNQSGSIQIGGEDSKNLPYSQLLDMISIVFQESYLFNDTIKNNMKLAKSNASDEEIIAAAKRQVVMSG